jgi:histidinol-phosphate/aromatic aminotransferase/cobyric acid decarboxylase-like protein
MITAVLKTVDNPEGFTINKKNLLNIFEEIQNVFIDELFYEYEDFISLDIKGSK